MKKGHDTCDPVALSRFSDGELTGEARARVDRHIKECRSCQQALRQDAELSALFRTEVEGALSKINLRGFELGVMERLRERMSPWWKRMGDHLVPRRLLVPATAMVALFLIVFSIVRTPVTVSEPSAIISSYSGEISSVMILETPKTRQTIIWFNEA